MEMTSSQKKGRVRTKSTSFGGLTLLNVDYSASQVTNKTAMR